MDFAITVTLTVALILIVLTGIGLIGQYIQKKLLHAGGRIYGEDLDGIDITTDRSFRTYIEDGKTWIVA